MNLRLTSADHFVACLPPISPDSTGLSPVAELGWDSVDLVEVMMVLDELGLVLEPEALLAYPSLTQLYMDATAAAVRTQLLASSLDLHDDASAI